MSLAIKLLEIAAEVAPSLVALARRGAEAAADPAAQGVSAEERSLAEQVLTTLPAESETKKALDELSAHG